LKGNDNGSILTSMVSPYENYPYLAVYSGFVIIHDDLKDYEKREGNLKMGRD